MFIKENIDPHLPIHPHTHRPDDILIECMLNNPLPDLVLTGHKNRLGWRINVYSEWVKEGKGACLPTQENSGEEWKVFLNLLVERHLVLYYEGIALLITKLRDKKFMREDTVSLLEMMQMGRVWLGRNLANNDHCMIDLKAWANGKASPPATHRCYTLDVIRLRRKRPMYSNWLKSCHLFSLC